MQKKSQKEIKAMLTELINNDTFYVHDVIDQSAADSSLTPRLVIDYDYIIEDNGAFDEAMTAVGED